MERRQLERLGLKACDMYERIHTEFSVIVRPGSLGLHLISDSPRGIKVVEVNEDSKYKGIIRKGDWFQSIDWEYLENVTLQGFRKFLSTDENEAKTLIVKRSYIRHVSLRTATANMVAFPYGCLGPQLRSPPPYLEVSAAIPSGPGTVKDLDENDTNKPLGIIWIKGKWAPMPKRKKRKYQKSDKQYEKQFGKKVKLSPVKAPKAPKEYRLKESALLKSNPVEREKAKQAIAAINSASGNKNDKAASLASAHLRGVTMRPSGKWQAQYYFAGKSQYIGVFSSRERAALAYEIAREHLKDKFVRDKEHATARVCTARKAAFEGVNETSSYHEFADKKTAAVEFADKKTAAVEQEDKCERKEDEADSTTHGPYFWRHEQIKENINKEEEARLYLDQRLEEQAKKSQVVAPPLKLFHNLMQRSSSEVSGSEEDSSSGSSDESSDSDEQDDPETEVYRLEKGAGVSIYTRHKRKDFEHRLWELKSFAQEHGHCNLSRNNNENPSLGRWAEDTRLAYQKQQNGEMIKRKLTDIEIQRLEKIGFQWFLTTQEIGDKPRLSPKKRATQQEISLPTYAKPRNLTFEERFGALSAFSKSHGHSDITRSSKVDPSLGRWCEDTRYTYHNQNSGGTSKRRRKLTDDEIESLESIGFKWVIPSKLKKSEPSTTKIPSKAETKKAAHINLTNSSPKSPSPPFKMSAFDEKFIELEDFKYKYGHVDLTSQTKNNPALGNWCFNIRQAYNKLKKGKRTNMKLSEEEIVRLQDIGFKWDL